MIAREPSIQLSPEDLAAALYQEAQRNQQERGQGETRRRPRQQGEPSTEIEEQEEEVARRIVFEVEEDGEIYQPNLLNLDVTKFEPLDEKAGWRERHRRSRDVKAASEKLRFQAGHNRREMQIYKQSVKGEKRVGEKKALVRKVQNETEIGTAPMAIWRVAQMGRPGGGFPKPPKEAISSSKTLADYAEEAIDSTFISPREMLDLAESGLRRVIDTQLGIVFATRMVRNKREELLSRGISKFLGRENTLADAKELLSRMDKPVEEQIADAQIAVCEEYPYDVEQTVMNSPVSLQDLIERVGLAQEELSEARIRKRKKAGETIPSEDWQTFDRYVRRKSPEQATINLLEDALDTDPNSTRGTSARHIIQSSCPDLTPIELREYLATLENNPQVSELTRRILETKERTMGDISANDLEKERFIRGCLYSKEGNRTRKRTAKESLELLMETAKQDDSQEGKMARFLLRQIAASIPEIQDERQAGEFSKFIRDAQTPGTEAAFKPNILDRINQTPEERLNLPVTKLALTERTQDALTIMALTDNGLSCLTGTKFDSGGRLHPMIRELGATNLGLFHDGLKGEFLDNRPPVGKLGEYMMMPDVLRTLAVLTTGEDTEEKALTSSLMFPDAEKALKSAFGASSTTWIRRKDGHRREYLLKLLHAAEASANAVAPGWNEDEKRKGYATVLADHFTDLVLEGMVDVTRANEEGISKKEKSKREKFGGFCATLAAKWCKYVTPELALKLFERFDDQIAKNKETVLLEEPQYLKLALSVAARVEREAPPELSRQASLQFGDLLYRIARTVAPRANQLAEGWADKKTGPTSPLAALAKFITGCLPPADHFHLKEGIVIPLVGAGERGLPDLSLHDLRPKEPQLQSSVDVLGLPGLSSQPRVTQETAALSMLWMLTSQLSKIQIGEGKTRAMTLETIHTGKRAVDFAASPNLQDRVETGMVQRAAERGGKALATQTGKLETLGAETNALEDFLASLLDESGLVVRIQSAPGTRGVDVARTYFIVEGIKTEKLPPLVAQIGLEKYHEMSEDLRQRFALDAKPVSPSDLRDYLIKTRRLKRGLGLL